jgi:hypothetical protein
MTKLFLKKNFDKSGKNTFVTSHNMLYLAAESDGYKQGLKGSVFILFKPINFDSNFLELYSI